MVVFARRELGVSEAGYGLVLTGFAVGLFFIIRRLLGIEIAQTGFTTLVTLLLFIGGIQLIGIGILGEYIGVIWTHVRDVPHVFELERINFE